MRAVLNLRTYDYFICRLYVLTSTNVPIYTTLSSTLGILVNRNADF